MSSPTPVNDDGELNRSLANPNVCEQASGSAEKVKGAARIEQLSKHFTKSRRYQNDLGIMDFDFECHKFLSGLQLSPSEINSLQQQTIGQSCIPIWKVERRKRLTASNFGRVVHFQDTTYRRNLVEELLSLAPKYKSPAMEHGLQNELRAIFAYEKYTKRTVVPCGLFVHPEFGYLGASPDGLVGEDGIVEVKCPHSDLLPFKPPNYLENTICVEYKSRSILRLSLNHDYYFQVQGQLEITGRKYCDFVVWTPTGIQHIERIERDKSVWNAMFPKLETFYKQSLLPELVDPRIPRSLPIREPDFVVEANEMKGK